MGFKGKGRISSSNDIDSGEYTGPSPSGSLGLDLDTGGRGGVSDSIRDAVTDTAKKAPKSSIGFGIGKSAAGNLGIGVEIPLPVPAPVSGRGGVSIDPRTGKIRGGYGGLGIGKGPIGGSIDVGVDTPPGSEDFGCFKYVTVSLGPFSHTYGKNECEPKGIPPSPPSSSSSPNDGSFKRGEVPPFNPKCTYTVSILCLGDGIEFIECTGYGSNESSQGWMFKSSKPAPGIYGAFGKRTKHPYGYYVYEIDTFPEVVGYVEIRALGYSRAVVKGDLIKGAGPWYRDDAPKIGTNVVYPGAAYYSSYWTAYSGLSAAGATQFCATFMNQWPMTGFADYRIKIDQRCPGDTDYQPLVPNTFLFSPPSYSPPLPNPPPRKKMDDACCKRVEILQLETLRMLGRQIVNGKLVPISAVAPKGFLGEKIKRTETPILDGKKPKEIEITFPTLYQLLIYALKQANDLDTALDPQSYKIPKGYIPNPEYNRDSEYSLKNNSQPDKDKAGNDRELEINDSDKAKMGGFLQQQQYMFNALRRLEYLFPSGELSDAKIAKDLLIPGQEGDIKIHNMIMAYEIQMQYINATLGNPREVLTVKDANPAIKGDQPIEVKALTLSDWMRQVVKFQIDTGGDVDAAINLMLRDFRTNLANRTDIIKTAEMTQALFEDSGMREQQEYIEVHLEGDPYAGQWVKGQGFKANLDLEKKTEEATEKVLQETMNPTEIKLKVSRRHKEEKTDMRDLFRGLADFVQRLLSIPSAGDAAKSIDKLIESAKFKVQTDMALIRQNVVKAATASRNRTKKRKK